MVFVLVGAFGMRIPILALLFVIVNIDKRYACLDEPSSQKVVLAAHFTGIAHFAATAIDLACG